MPPLKIFLVEDDDILAKTTEWRVRKLGYEFLGKAASGKEAVKRVLELQPDIILMDINLRGETDGIETAGIILEQKKIPIIYITAIADDQTLARAKKTNPKSYLVKPFNDKELMMAIEFAAR